MIKNFIRQAKKFVPKKASTNQTRSVYLDLFHGNLLMFYTNYQVVCKTKLRVEDSSIEDNDIYKASISTLDSALKNLKNNIRIEIIKEKMTLSDDKGNKEVVILEPTGSNYYYFDFIGDTKDSKEICQVDTKLWKVIALATTEELDSNFSYIRLAKDTLCGLDGHRVHYKKGIATSIKGDKDYYIYGSIIRNLTEKEYTLSDVNKDTMQLDCEHCSIYFKKYNGVYLKWEKHVMVEPNHVVAVDVADLVANIKELEPELKKDKLNRLFLDFLNNELRTHSGETKPFKFGIVMEKEPLSQILLDYNFLLDALKCGDKAMGLKMVDKHSGVIVCGSICNACIMPMLQGH